MADACPLSTRPNIDAPDLGMPTGSRYRAPGGIVCIAPPCGQNGGGGGCPPRRNTCHVLAINHQSNCLLLDGGAGHRRRSYVGREERSAGCPTRGGIAL